MAIDEAAPLRHADEEDFAAVRAGTRVRYDGVIDDERDLEREGIVRDQRRGDVLVEWTFLGESELQWESPAWLEPIDGAPPNSATEHMPQWQALDGT